MFRSLVGVMSIVLLLAAGCATQRKITFGTQPPDAILKIDGVEIGRGPVTRTLEFKDADDVHRVTAARAGYKEATISLTRDFKDRQLLIELRPLTRRISFTVLPAPAIIRIDGKAMSDEPALSASRELEFTLDDHNRWTSYVVTAEREGFTPARLVVSWPDDKTDYGLELTPMRKDLRITTEPAGASVFIDDEQAGISPTTAPGVGFHIDPTTGQWTTRLLRVERPGYDPVEQTISWDDARGEYHVDLAARRKQVRIITEPPGAAVSIDGEPLTQRDELGIALADLEFPPINEQGELRVYELGVSSKSADAEYYPATQPLAWDEGTSEYIVRLKEILTRPVDLLSLDMRRRDNTWIATPLTSSTLAMKSISEGDLAGKPLRLIRSPAGGVIDALAVSPDGSRIVYNVLTAADGDEIRSQLMTVATDGGGGAVILTDGRTLDVTPVFTPDGTDIVFSSNRATTRLSIWQMSADGAPGVTQLTSGDSNDLWPIIDSDPKPRLFYQAFIDARDQAKLFMSQLGAVTRTDLTSIAGAQPRINPQADRLVFTAPNAKTGKRDLFLLSDRGGVAENLTDTPDIDECDPNWSRDGRRIVFSADRGLDDEKRANHDIWTMTVENPAQPTQITINGSHDDRPAWDPSGRYLYFRSNRGGEWCIWKLAIGDDPN